jgi:uncharacterized protein with von Willebrand factor type A (vWA) domain
MFVHHLDGSVMELVEQPSGNYVFKPTYNSDTTVTVYNMVSTVAQQKKVFTRRQVEADDVEQELYKRKATVLASTVVDHTLPLLSSVRQPKFL